MAFQLGDTVEISDYTIGKWVLAGVDTVNADGSVAAVRSMTRNTYPAGSTKIRKHIPCDECYVRPDGISEDGTTCPCSVREPAGGCRCVPYQAEWLGPAYIRAEIAAQEV